MLSQILPDNLSLPIIFVVKFILFIAFPLGNLGKEIRGKLCSKCYIKTKYDSLNNDRPD